MVTLSGTTYAGVPVTAADVPGGLTRVTDATGRWSFEIVPPGNYTVTETQPTAYLDGLEQNGDTVGPNTVVIGNDVFSNIVLTSGQLRGPFNFGEYLPVFSKRDVLNDSLIVPATTTTSLSIFSPAVAIPGPPLQSVSFVAANAGTVAANKPQQPDQLTQRLLTTSSSSEKTAAIDAVFAG